MVDRMELPSDEFLYFLDGNYFSGLIVRKTLPKGTNEISDTYFDFKSSVPNQIKVKTIIDVIRLVSNITTSKTY